MSKTLSEAEWLSAADPQPLLEALRAAGGVSERKLRLWACACVRRVWQYLGDPRTRRAVEVVEAFADGQLGIEELLIAAKEADRVRKETEQEADRRKTPSGPHLLNDWEAETRCAGASAGWYTTGKWFTRSGEPVADFDPRLAARASAGTVLFAHGGNPCLPTALPSAAKAAKAVECVAQADLLRHIFGNPFRPLSFPAALPPAIIGLAEAVYRGDNVAFALSDALCERGFQEFAEHFREPVHPKGCAWLDAILGRS